MSTAHCRCGLVLRCVLSLLASHLCVGARAAAPPALVGNDPIIEGLIRQLGDDDFKVREAAQKRLAGLPSALPHLHLATASRDLEISRRAKRLIPTLIWHATLLLKRRMAAAARNR